MGAIIPIILAVLAIILIAILIKALLTRLRLVKAFRNGNVIVFGKKGRGKDLLFQKIINSRHEKYTANITYGGEYVAEEWPKEKNCDPNTYQNFICNDVKTIIKKPELEGVDYYISDGGIILPSQMDSTLHKLFPSFPIFYALSRHLYNSNIHINTQNIERVWKSLREQADYFVKCRGVINLPFFLVVKTTEYDRYQSAVNDVRTFTGGGIFNRFSRAEEATYNASNGFIKDGFIIIRKKAINYDTRAYHVKLFGYEAPKKGKKKIAEESPDPVE